MTTAHASALPDPPNPLLELERQRDELRSAFLEALYLVEHPELVTGTRVRALRDRAGIRPDATPEQLRDEGIARAAARWTSEELAAVDKAIRDVAAEGEPFTTDDVWRKLGPGFPVTKGIAGRLLAAVGAGVIVNTGLTDRSTRQDAHGHGQRLTVWRPAS